MSGPSILLVEDEAPARRALADYLERRGYETREAGTAQEAMRLWDARRADLVLLDLGLPDLDGVDVIHRIRREATTPIIILSARGDERDKIAGLEAGADDYLAKPFATDELNARIRAVLRRAGGPDADAQGCLRLGPIELDTVRREVLVSGETVRLTPREYAVLALLMTRIGQILTKAEIEAQVYALDDEAESNTVEAAIYAIRKKLGRELIGMVRGVGYVIPGK